MNRERRKSSAKKYKMFVNGKFNDDYPLSYNFLLGKEERDYEPIKKEVKHNYSYCYE